MKQTFVEMLMEIFNQILEDELLLGEDSSRLIEKLQQTDMTATENEQQQRQIKIKQVIEKYFNTFSKVQGFRVLDETELAKIGENGWRFLLSLQQTGVVPAWVRELILHECVKSDKERFTLTELKTLIFEIMRHILRKEEDMAWLEYFLFYTRENKQQH